MWPGPKTHSCLRHRSNKALLGFVSSGGHATTRRPRGSAQKPCAISTVSQDQNRNQVRNVCTSSCKSSPELFINDVPSSLSKRLCSLKCAPLFRRFWAVGRYHWGGGGRGKRGNFQRFIHAVFFPRGRIRSDVNSRMMELSLSCLTTWLSNNYGSYQHGAVFP